MNKSHPRRHRYSQFGGKKQSFKQKLLSQPAELKNEAMNAMRTMKMQFTEVAKNIAHLFRDLTKAHGRLWSHRIGRIQAPNFTSHANSIVTLVLVSMQVFLLLGSIKATDGHIGNVKHIATIMIPAYFALGLNLLLQVSALYFVVNRALNEEPRQTIFPQRSELNRFLPILEHIVIVIAYALFLLTAYAIGSCHLNFSPDQQTGLCVSFNLNTVQVVMGIVVAVKLLHHIISIYNHYHHTADPSQSSQKLYRGGQRGDNQSSDFVVGGDEEENNDGILDSMYTLDQSFVEGWQFWKVRMNRIMSANVADNMCKIWGITFLGGFLILLVTQVHNSHGNLGNITDMPKQIWPLYVMFFGKAAIQMVVLLYVYFNHFPHERRLEFMQSIRDHPSQSWKVLEHFLPVTTNVFFGLLTMAIGQCHLNPTLDKGQGMCQVFPYKIIVGVLVVVAMIQFLHHVLAMWHFHRHCDVPEAHPSSDSFELKVNKTQKGASLDM